MAVCRLLTEDGECPNGLEPAWCTSCLGKDDDAAKLARTVDYSFNAIYGSALDCGHVPESGELCARMRDGTTKCHTCSGLSNNPRLIEERQ